MQYVSGFPFMSLEGRRVVVVRILCSGVLYIEEQSLWGYIQAPNPSLGFSPSWAWETGSPERSAPAANRRHRRPLQPNPLLGFPTAQGRGAGSRTNTLGALATLPLTRCPGSLRAAPVSPAAASMRGASLGWRIPGVRGARPAPPRPLGPPPALAHPPAVRLRSLGGRDFRAVPGPQGALLWRAAAWAGWPGCRSAAAAAAAGAQQPASPGAVRQPTGPPPPGAMAGSSSLEAVRRKIRSLQEQADAAEERAGSLQRELDYERKLRETANASSTPEQDFRGR
ncbi:caskin-1-like isoform X2 [Lagenorhynchus albirostris]|uniref:caskin-1-like isoform X2 n=1 Tax=Lagenorhynchus albirostris TaxID=27610 RepID=UPI0028EC3947|nr:caskin-1-like isoform X2 [Lagenorhynchus albirostris]